MTTEAEIGRTKRTLLELAAQLKDVSRECKALCFRGSNFGNLFVEIGVKVVTVIISIEFLTMPLC